MKRTCGMMIKQIHDCLEKDTNNTLRAQDLTMAQVGALIELRSAEEKQMPLKELERRLHVAQSTAAGIVVRLEQKGFLESFGSSDDRRIKMVRITPKGEDCCLDSDRGRAGRTKTAAFFDPGRENGVSGLIGKSMQWHEVK